MKPQSQPRPLCAQAAFLLEWRLLRLRFHNKVGDFLAALVVRLLSPSVVRAPLLAALALAGAALLSIPAGEAHGDVRTGGTHNMWTSVQNGRAGEISHFVSAHKWNVNTHNYQGFSLLHTAARTGHANSGHVASALLRAGANVNARTDTGGFTALHYAAIPHLAAVLISAGANVNATTAAGNTPLHYAVNNRRVSVVATLIAAGGHYGEACLNGFVVNSERHTPPCVCPADALTNGECEVVAVCDSPSVRDPSTNGCDCPAPNIGEDGKDAPGVCAAPSAQVCAGLDPPEYYAATLSACVPFAVCPAEATLDDKTNTCEFSAESCGAVSPPLFYDSSTGECGDRLFPCHDSAIVKADNSGCECPAGAFAHKPHAGGRWSFVRSEWRKYGTAECHADHAPIQHTLQPGDWLAAVRANNPAIVAHFISGHKWDPDAGDALHAAAAGGHHQAAKVLIEGGADIHRKRNGAMPLHAAVENGRGPLITLLLQRGANPDIADGDGNTALHLAARRTDTAENAELISFLLDKGATPNPRNGDGWRPLDIAYDGGNAATWQARRGIMAALIAGGATWSDECTGGAIPNSLYEGAAAVATYPRCACPRHISQRDSFGACECPAHSHAQVNGRCLPKDSVQVAAEIMKMETALLSLRAALVSLNARLSAAAEMPREMVEEIAEQAGETAQEIKRRRDNFISLARADLAGDPAPPVAMSDTAAECRMLGGEVQIHPATGIRVCSGIDAQDTFCLVNSSGAFPCRGLFRHVRQCNDGHNRPALNPFFCGPECGNQSARGAKCGVPAL